MSQSKRQATVENVERESSYYILHKLGDRLWAGEPVYDEDQERWTVPIHSLSLPTEEVLGQITLDSNGVIIKAPSRRKVQRAVKQAIYAKRGKLFWSVWIQRLRGRLAFGLSLQRALIFASIAIISFVVLRERLFAPVPEYRKSKYAEKKEIEIPEAPDGKAKRVPTPKYLKPNYAEEEKEPKRPGTPVERFEHAPIPEPSKYKEKKEIETPRAPVEGLFERAPLLVKLSDTTGEVTVTANGKLSLPAIPTLPSKWTQQLKELLKKGTVSQSKEIQLAMAQVQRDIIMMRGSDERSTSILLSPVATAVKSTRPTFRWAPVKDAQSYKLIIANQDQTEVIWKGDAGTQTQFSLPTNAPALKRGETYSWLVEATVGGEPRLSEWVKFRVLDGAALVEVTRLEQRYGKSALVLGGVYEAHGLYEDAQKQFERLQQLNPNNPMVKRMLDALQQIRIRK